jgi:DNA repair photolyase
VVRDVDILQRFKKIEVSFTITTVDDRIRRIFEPGAPSSEQRFKAIRTLSRTGIATTVFVAPVIPYLSDTDDTLNKIFRYSRLSGAQYVRFDTLNPYPKVWHNMKRLIKSNFPGLLEQYDYFYNNRKMYTVRLRRKIGEIAKKHKMDYKLVF